MLHRSIALLLLLAACVSPSAAPPIPAAAPAAYDETSSCADAPADSPICIDDVADLDAAIARSALGERELAVSRNRDRLTVFARVAGDSAPLCCSLQGTMTRLGETDLFAIRYRLANLDHASLNFIPPAWLMSGRNFRSEEITRWAGPSAPSLPSVAEELHGERMERALWSEHLQETRKIYFYLPPGYDRSHTYPAVFMADGASVMVQAPLFERMITEGRMAPTVFVGAGSGQESIVEDRSSLGISDFRSADYLPGFETRVPRYEQHLRFFTEELAAYARREFNISADPRDRVVTGFSNGGSFSLYAALRRPDVFGVSMPLSPSWDHLTDADFAQPQHARFFMSAGLYEIQRHRRTAEYAQVLTTRGYDVTMETPTTGHDRDQEILMLARYLPMALPPLR